MMKRSLRVLSPLVLALLSSAPAHARDLPGYNAFYDRAATTAAAPVSRAQTPPGAAPFVVTSVDPLRGVPTFLRAARPAPSAKPAGRTPEEAARASLATYADVYGLSPAALAAAVVHEVHDTGRGGIVVTLRQAVGGVELFRSDVKVLLTRRMDLVAISGSLRPEATAGMKPAARAFQRDAAEALARAFNDLYGLGVSASSMVPGERAEGGYRAFALAPNAAVSAAGLAFTRPARVKKVFFPLPDEIVPAYYVEVFAGKTDETSSDTYAYVVSARDGRVLYRANLTASESFHYRVWADKTGDKRPLDGPIEDFTPSPSGQPDGVFPAFIPPNDITMEGFNENPLGEVDPWLSSTASQTLGNNIDAYTDDNAPDGYSNGDLRATTTDDGVFDRVFDTAAEPDGSQDQRMAAATQLFYTTNWLHDWYYDSGFDEASGNAQQKNFDRGGLGSDPLHAEAQDAGSLDNANMSTPADGASPRMQMYLWSGKETRSLQISPLNQSLDTGSAEFGSKQFDLVGDVVLADDGVDPKNDACEAIVNDVAGKIALVDRGACAFEQKASAAQEAGAIGLLVANHTAGAGAPHMPGADTVEGVTIPVLSVSLEDGDAIKAALEAGAVTATLSRATGPYADGTIDNPVVAHEWGHYLHHRLVDCSTNQCDGESEGWGDFIALAMMVRPGDDLQGTYADTIYAMISEQDSAYFGTRRAPYSADMTKNALTFKHISDGEQLPQAQPLNDNGNDNSEVHNAGEIWASMLFQGYVALLERSQGSSPAYSFQEAQRRMSDYVVAGMKLAPVDPTMTEQRDAILAAAYAADEEDMLALAGGFALRGAGSCAVGPERDSLDNAGVVESYELKGNLLITQVTLDDSVRSCDGDGKLDGEETGHVTIQVMNAGTVALPGGTLTLTSGAPGVTFPNGATANLLTLKPFDVMSTTIDIALDRGLTEAGALDLDVVADTVGSCSPSVSHASLWRVNYDNAAGASMTDTFDSDLTTWTLAGEEPENVWSRFQKEELNQVYRGVDFSDVTDTALVSPELQVSSTDPLVLTFKQRYSFEASLDENPVVYWDGGVIEVSTGNDVWEDISAYADPGYEGKIDNTAHNPLADREAFVSENASWPAADTTTLDLGTAFSGKSIRIRFRIGSDEGVGAFGWELDDVAFSGLINDPFASVIPDASSCNQAPVADAGVDQAVASGADVKLDASKSSDPEGDTITFAWAQVEGPSVELVSADTATPSFKAPAITAETALTFEVTVSDGSGSATDKVVVTVAPSSVAPALHNVVDDSGCGCGVAGDPKEASAVPFFAGVLALLLRRKKR